MFKKVNTKEGSPICIAEAKWYTVARDDDKFARWMLSAGEKLGDLVKLVEEEAEKSKGVKEATDIFTVSYDIDKIECEASSKIPSREEAGKYVDIPYKVAAYAGKKFIMATRSGRPLTKEECSRFAHDVEMVFSTTGNIVGAIYMEVEIDGRKSVWFNDESCYEACELPPDRLAKPDTMSELARLLKKKGVDVGDIKGELNDLIKDLKDTKPLDETDEALGNEIIGCLNGFNDFLKKVSEL